MKTLQRLFLMTVLVLSSQFAFANGGNDLSGTTLTEEIVSQIDFPRSEMNSENLTRATLVFRVLEDHTLEIVNVKSENNEVASYLSNTLNGTKVKANDQMVGHRYEVSISFEWL